MGLQGEPDNSAHTKQISTSPKARFETNTGGGPCLKITL